MHTGIGHNRKLLRGGSKSITARFHRPHTFDLSLCCTAEWLYIDRKPDFPQFMNIKDKTTAHDVGRCQIGLR